jgi:hypothetical protein
VTFFYFLLHFFDTHQQEFLYINSGYMAKHSHLKIIFLLLPAMILIPRIICALLNAPEVLHPLTTKYAALSTDSAVFTADTAAQKAIPALQSAITIGDFKFRIVRIVFDETAMGFVPVDMTADDQVIFVEFELLAGKKECFKGLEITISHGFGRKSRAIILISDGMIQMLTAVTMKGNSSDYQPGKDNVVWAYMVPKGVDKLYLNFPTGEVIDLKPFILVL